MSEGKKKRVLRVTDGTDHLLTKWLTDDAYEVIEVDGAAQALALVAREQFDIIFVNNRSPGEATLRASEILESIGDAFFSLDTDLRFTYVNHKAEELWGRQREDLLGRKFLDVFPQSAGTHSHQEILRALNESRPLTYETISPILNRWVEASAYPSSGGLSVYFRDITKRKQDEEVLRESEEFNRRIVESSSDCIKILDIEGRLLYISPRGQELLGIEDPDAYINGSWIDLWPGEGRLAARAAIEQAKAGGIGMFQAFGPTPQGQPKWWDTVITPMTDAQGRVVRLMAVSRDTTESKRAEETVRQRDHLLGAIFDSVSAHVAVLDDKGVITRVSRSWEAFAEQNNGRMEQVGVGANYLEVCRAAAQPHDRTAREAFEGIEAVLAGERPTFSVAYPCHSPTEQRWFLMNVDPLPPEHGGMVISHIDITERKLAEEALQRAMEEVSRLKNQLQEENIYLREEIKRESNFDEIVGRSDAIRSVLHKIERVAPTDTTVLITGETGTGKELVALAVHRESLRRDRPLVKVNCAALSPSLIESELFGHEKGAFTGAVTRKIGRFELADGATLFLDEIGELPTELQAKLLRVLQDGEFERLGSARTIKVDVRIIAATNRNLLQEVRAGRFREDLWYRLNVFPITVPPLRQRQEDIPPLVEHFVAAFSKKMGKKVTSLAPATLGALSDYSWPGNVRELANVIERAVITSVGLVLQISNFAETLPTETPSTPNKTLEQIEREYILSVLDSTGWRIEGQDGAARILGLPPSTLRTRMIKLKIQNRRIVDLGLRNVD